jgi:CDP-glycerol glycerophosphotransferase
LRIAAIKQKAQTAVKLVVRLFTKMLQDSQFKRSMKYARFFNKLKIQNNVILYETFHGKAMTDSPYAIFKKLINDPNYRDYKHVWALDSHENVYASAYKDQKNVEFVRVHSDQYIRYLTSAKYLINNTTFPTYFQKKEGQVYVNTWHGTPLKTLGKDMLGGIGQHKNIQRNLLHSDYILNPNQYTADVLVNSHDLEGVYNGKIVVEGYPRIDLTLHANKEEMKKMLSNIVQVDFNKKIILYAPTWRGEVHSVSDTVEEINTVIHQLVDKLPSEYQLLLKVHTLTYNRIKENDKLKNICIPDWVDTNELLSVVDILITDYSSLFFDFLVTKKPIIFYMYDRVLYEEERGLYLNLDLLPGPICTNTNDVLNMITNLKSLSEDYQDRYQAMLAEYCTADDGYATKRNIDIIFHSKDSNKVFQVRNDKINMLFYCGGFLNNGITNSAINLFNHIDYSKYNVAIIDKGKHNDTSGKNFNQVNDNVKKFFRVGRMNATITEFIIHHLIMKKGLRYKKLHKYIPVSLYKREIERLLGNVKFDIVVDFSGYVPFWSLLFAFGDFPKKNIYQHNDMMAEYHKKINNKYKHQLNLNIIFPLYQYFDKVISVAEHTRNINIENLKDFIPEEKAVYVHNCIDPEKVLKQMNEGEIFRQGQSEFLLVNNSVKGGKLTINGIAMPMKENINFVSMGRLSPEKDQKKQIRAFSKIAHLHENVRLFIIGEGVLEAELKGLSAKLGLGEKVIFTGQLSNPFYFIQKCDCFILSSNHEGQPMVLLEALVLGIPIISTDIPGSRSVLKDGYGELVENSENGLIKGIEKFLTTNIPSKKFNYVDYNKEALKMFYYEVCNLNQKSRC